MNPKKNKSNEYNLRIGYLITARLKSTRLPKKLLLEIKGKSILSHMIDRLKLIKSVDEIIICTSYEDQDKPLINIANENQIKYFLGDPNDVIKRLYDASEEFNLDYVLNITADCPLVDPVYADLIVDKFIETDADLIRQLDLPHGVFSYGIKVSALKKINEIKDSNHTEVWGKYFTDTGIFSILDLDVTDDFHRRPGLRMTVDYPEDFEFLKRVFAELYQKNKMITLDEILTLLDKNPEIIEINKNCGNMFKKRFSSQMNIKLKKKMKVKSAIVVGSGSIGQRHIKNLKTLGINKIYCLRSKKGHFKNLPDTIDVKEFQSWGDIPKIKADIAIISNPTSLHLEAAKKIFPFVNGLLVEKPLSNSIDGCVDFIDLCNKEKVVTFSAHNLLFHPIVLFIKKFIDKNDLGRIINFQLQVGQWIEDWHPYEDYKKSYFSRSELGGGVTLTLIHEIYLALDLMGRAKEVSCFMLDGEELGINVDISSDIMIRHINDTVSQIHMDYLQKKHHRTGLISFEKGWISYDFSNLTIHACSIEDSEPKLIWSNNEYDNNKMYLDQLEQFIQFVEEGRINHDFHLNKALDSMYVVDAAHKSTKHGKAIKIENFNNSNYFGI